MKNRRFPLPLSVLLIEYSAILLGMAGFAVIVAIVVSLLFVVWHFLIGDRKLDGLFTVATVTFLISFLAYVVSDFTRKKEGLLRRFLLFRRAGEKFLKEGNYDKAVVYLQEGITSLQMYQDAMPNPIYNDLLEEANISLKHALDGQQYK